MKVVSVVGARPQFVKLAPLCRAIAKHNGSANVWIDHEVVHTGQHYDASLSDQIFNDLEMSPPDVQLGVGSGSHGRQTARMLELLDEVLDDLAPSLVVVFGDTNSTLAGALAAAKRGLRLVHVEAGLRSFDRRMPEELNRVTTDHLSDHLFAPTPTAMSNLSKENLAARAELTGDIMYDAVLQHADLAQARRNASVTLDDLPPDFGVVTLHRAGNTEPAALLPLLDTLNRVAADQLPLLFLVHPRTAAQIRAGLATWKPAARLQLRKPVGYLDMLWLTSQAQLVLTDSGGLQKEAFFLDCPCVTLREETEWPETVQGGGNLLVGRDPDKISAAVEHWQRRAQLRTDDFSASARESFGDGKAAERMVTCLLKFGSECTVQINPVR